MTSHDTGLCLAVYCVMLKFTNDLCREAEKADADASGEDEEIFFGPVGHTEKCVAVGVNEVAQANDKLRPLSPLTATQMAELCREAYTVAYQIEHADSSEPLSSHAEITGLLGNDEVPKINPVEDLTSNVVVTDRSPCVDKALSTNTCDDLISGSTESGKELCDDKTSSNNVFIDKALSTNTWDDLIPGSTESAKELCDDKTSFNNVFVDKALSTNTCNDLIPGSTESAKELCDDKTSSDNVFVDKALSTNTCDDLIRGSTESGKESCDEKTSPNNVFEDILSSLGSALPAIEPGSLKLDEHGAVKFSAAADHASAADANTKLRTAIPAPSGLRRAVSAKTSVTRSAGIPMKVLTVRQ